MSEISIAVLYRSRLGHTEVIARCIGEGAVDGVTATLVAEAEARIDELDRYMAGKPG